MRKHRKETILITAVMTATALATVLPAATPDLHHGIVSAVDSTVVSVDSGTTPNSPNIYHDF